MTMRFGPMEPTRRSRTSPCALTRISMIVAANSDRRRSGAAACRSRLPAQAVQIAANRTSAQMRLDFGTGVALGPQTLIELVRAADGIGLQRSVRAAVRRSRFDPSLGREAAAPAFNRHRQPPSRGAGIIARRMQRRRRRGDSDTARANVRVLTPPLGFSLVEACIGIVTIGLASAAALARFVQ